MNVAALRTTTGLPQLEFAQRIGVRKGTLPNWKHRRRHPTGSAQVLLARRAKKPSIVNDLFANLHAYQLQPVRAWLPRSYIPVI